MLWQKTTLNIQSNNALQKKHKCLKNVQKKIPSVDSTNAHENSEMEFSLSV